MKFLLGFDNEEQMEAYAREAGCTVFPGKELSPGLDRLAAMEKELVTSRDREIGQQVCLWFPESGVHSTLVNDLLREVLYHDMTSGEVIIATFSSSMVNSIGHLIANGKMKPEDVEILMFEDDEETVTKHRFTKEGYLQSGWPYGWFTPWDSGTDWMQAE